MAGMTQSSESLAYIDQESSARAEAPLLLKPYLAKPRTSRPESQPATAVCMWKMYTYTYIQMYTHTYVQLYMYIILYICTYIYMVTPPKIYTRLFRVTAQVASLHWYMT